MNKPVYLGLTILELCKILIYEFWSIQNMMKKQNCVMCNINCTNENVIFIKTLQKMLKLQSQTKYLAQSKKVLQNWTRLQTFDV